MSSSNDPNAILAKPTTKRVAKPKVSPAKGESKPTKKNAKPKSAPKPAPPEKPFLRFYHSDELRARTLHVLATVEQAEDTTRYRGALADLVMELTDSGLDYYFMRPLNLAKVNFVVNRSAHMGMGSVRRVMSPVIRNIIGRMDERQLLGVCAYIRELMV
jgi:hypothetical protein